MFLIILVFLRIYNIHCILKKHLEVYFSEIHQALTCLPVFALGLKSNRELICMIARRVAMEFYHLSAAQDGLMKFSVQIHCQWLQFSAKGKYAHINVPKLVYSTLLNCHIFTGEKLSLEKQCCSAFIYDFFPLLISNNFTFPDPFSTRNTGNCSNLSWSTLCSYLVYANISNNQNKKDSIGIIHIIC